MRLATLVVTVLLAVTACAGDVEGDPDGLGPQSSAPQPSTRTGEPSSPSSPSSPATSSPSTSAPPSGPPQVVRTIASGLSVPWGVAFLPDGSALVTERDTARVLSIRDGRVREVGRLDQAMPQGEGGLLGLAVSPSYSQDGRVFAYLTSPEDNRVVRMQYDGRRLGPAEPILTGIPSAFIHDGGRLLFGPDGYLYVSTGDASVGELAQDRDSLAGKILRITADGDPAPGNPVAGSPVWTMGHRNVQGLAFDDRDRLWASEFGSSLWDELNRIEKGRNYGWPLVEGRGDLPEYRNPFVQWRTNEASPSGLAYVDGHLWLGALRGARVWRVPVTAEGVGQPQDFFVGEFGRLRSVVAAPNGTLWVTTSNRDGRGDPAPSDDRILEVRPFSR